MRSGLAALLLLHASGAAALVVAPPAHAALLRPAPVVARSADVECGVAGAVVSRVKGFKVGAVIRRVRNFFKPLSKSDDAAPSAAPMPAKKKLKSAKLSNEMKKVAEFADLLYDKRVASRDPDLSPSAYEIEKYCESKPEGCNLSMIEKLQSEAAALREAESATKKKKGFFADLEDPVRWSEEVEE